MKVGDIVIIHLFGSVTFPDGCKGIIRDIDNSNKIHPYYVEGEYHTMHFSEDELEPVNCSIGNILHKHFDYGADKL